MDAGAVLLEDLDEAQRRAVTSQAMPLCIIAGAGSGKTRVLTRRIAWRCATAAADPRHVLALTFTRKAAGELKARLRRLGLRDEVAAGTFHALAYASLRGWWADRGVNPPALVESKLALISRAMPRSRSGAVRAVDFATEIEWAKARMITPDRYAAAATAAGRRPPIDAATTAATFAGYEEAKRKAWTVDFDDLLGLCARALETDADLAAAQRWRYRHLHVDEFQDVNPLQFRLLEAWRGSAVDLCVVGDPNQAIYAWNGADPGYLTGFVDRFPGAEVVTLDRNYRSAPQVIAVANAVLAAGGDGFRLRATRSDGPIPSVHAHPSDVAEARAVARAIIDLHGPGVPWSHQAVLVRTNAQTIKFEEALRAAHVPYRVRGRANFFDLPGIADALGILRSARTLADAIADLEAGEVEEDERSDAEQTRWENVEEFVRLAHEYRTFATDPTTAGFEAWMTATVRGEDAASRADRVDVATFHAAKGLEWPIVHLAGLEAGLVPIGHARTIEAAAEERRLFYVAVTRAERTLRCSWAQQRTFGARTANRTASPYLDEVQLVIGALHAGERATDWRPHVAAQRDRLRAATPTVIRDAVATEDQPLFDALKHWRATAARAANVPAFVILNDSTLRELARTRPSTAGDLLAVPGIGPVKASRFGADVLAVVEAAL
jgi:DNA helicase-2/ATP-dependent DNA helicase PcrA